MPSGCPAGAVRFPALRERPDPWRHGLRRPRAWAVALDVEPLKAGVARGVMNRNGGPAGARSKADHEAALQDPPGWCQG